MSYLEFRKLFGQFTVFSIADIRQADPLFHRRRLNEWQEKGYIKKVLKGYYIFSDLPLDEETLFEIANRIYPPSYISFEMALSYYGLIPETVYNITSAATRKTSHFKTLIGDFTYRTIRPGLYFGFDFLKRQDKRFKIASPEKAFLDFFYMKPELKDDASFESLRVNRDVFIKLIDRRKMSGYLALYGQAAMKRRINGFWEYIKNA